MRMAYNIKALEIASQITIAKMQVNNAPANEAQGQMTADFLEVIYQKVKKIIEEK